MLRSWLIRKGIEEPYVCWKCCSSFHSTASTRRTSPFRSRSPDQNPRVNQSRRRNTGRSFSAAHHERAAIEADSPSKVVDNASILNDPHRPPIRECLRAWETENANVSNSTAGIFGKQNPGDLVNSTFSLPDSGLECASKIMYGSVFEREDLLDIGNRRHHYVSGDLVEYITPSGPELAIYIQLHEREALYTMSGRGIVRIVVTAMYNVQGFAEPHEVDEFRPFLPKPHETDKADFTPPLEVGKSMLIKMRKFWTEADTVYRTVSSKLEDAHRYLAHPTKFRYATLEEIAEQLLSRAISKSESGKYPQHALYAVHRALLRDNAVFRPVHRGTLWVGGQFEISPLSDSKDLSMAKDYVRQYQDAEVTQMLQSKFYPKRTPLHLFAAKCKRLIDRSRQNRQFTDFGMIGPLSMERKEELAPKSIDVDETFDDTDEIFIRFLETWTALSSFPVHSYANGIGSAILRAVGRYQEVDLVARTGWTFLQEIGVIPPWETRTPYALRLFSVGRRQHAMAHEDGFRQDNLSSLRKDWGNLPVYCIDDANAQEIDDGVSVEATDTPNEYWVHIHTADPASHIDPHSGTAKNAESQMSTVYGPQGAFPMLPNEFIQSHLSLAPDRPCLTFSAKTNPQGDILDTIVTPGIVRDVKYLSPAVLEEFVTGDPPVDDTVVSTVGSELPPPVGNKFGLDILEDTDKQSLILLRRIAEGRKKRLVSQGKISLSSSKISVSVFLNAASREGQKPGLSYRYYEDPTIQLRMPRFDSEGNIVRGVSTGRTTVEHLMLLAGEVAAKWCHERGIPVPYRVTPRSPTTIDPVAFYNDVVLPSRNAQGDAPPQIALEYLRLLRKTVPSTVPGRHASVGLDMMARCTSPLRRYGDLLLHWQVESTLLEEARTGQSLIGNGREDFLAFTKDQLDALLPQLDTRERLVKAANAASEHEWLCQYLVRAWYFKQAKLPFPLRFEVQNINPDFMKITGWLAEIPTAASLYPQEQKEFDEIKVGDQYEVELEDVNVYSGSIKVRPLKRLSVSDSDIFAGLPLRSIRGPQRA